MASNRPIRLHYVLFTVELIELEYLEGQLGHSLLGDVDQVHHLLAAAIALHSCISVWREVGVSDSNQVSKGEVVFHLYL